jgi:two-component system, NarL family, response regulator NreC
MGADTPAITVVLADDHAVVRAGLHLLLERTGDIEVVSEAGTAEDAVRTVLGHKPAVLVLDLNMPGELTSLDAIPKVAEASPGTRVVVLTMQEDPEFARRALRAGAAGYVLKEDPASVLVGAVAAVLRGDGVLPPALTARVIQEFRSREPRRRAVVRARTEPELTSREWEVLDLLRQGLTTAEIARKLFVSQGTVRSHVAAILRKLRAPDRSSAIRMFDQH